MHVPIMRPFGSNAHLLLLHGIRRPLDTACIGRSTRLWIGHRTLSKTAQCNAPQSRFAGRLGAVYRQQMHESPILFPVGLGLVAITGSMFMYGIYLHYKVRMNMAGFPEDVGVKLRRAKYFTDINPDAAQAMKAYLGAIQLAQAHEMHPLSDPVLGIYFELGNFLAKIGQVKEAIEVFENKREECLTWIELHGDKEGNSSDRTRLLKKSIQVGYKIGELFTSPYYTNKQKSHEYLVWSTETFLKERERRRQEGVSGEESDLGLDSDQQGAMLEGLAHSYEESNNFYFASQLFLQALMLKTTSDCHNVVLMNNIAAALAQQNPLPEPGQPPPSLEQLRESARVWARQSLELASKIKPPIRTDECDTGCVVATHNLGEFAEMDGNIREARERYEEAGSLAHAIGFNEGLIAANEGLKRLSAPPVKSSKGRFW